MLSGPVPETPTRPPVTPGSSVHNYVNPRLTFQAVSPRRSGPALRIYDNIEGTNLSFHIDTEGMETSAEYTDLNDNDQGRNGVPNCDDESAI